VLWHCWLGHLTRKIVPEMTHNMSCGTLNHTIPYHTITNGHRVHCMITFLVIDEFSLTQRCIILSADCLQRAVGNIRYTRAFYTVRCRTSSSSSSSSFIRSNKVPYTEMAVANRTTRHKMHWQVPKVNL